MLYNEEIDAQKVFESSTFFLDQKKKTLKKIQIEETFQYNNGYIGAIYNVHYTQKKKMSIFLSETNAPTFSILFSIMLEL